MQDDISPYFCIKLVCQWDTHNDHLCGCVCLCVSRYSIDRRTDMDRVFNVHSGNGSVFTLKSLDREENAWHNISIVATEFSKQLGTF